jgi:hypothetical protein
MTDAEFPEPESTVLSSTPLGNGASRSVTLAGTAPLVAAAAFGAAFLVCGRETAGISVFVCSIAMPPSAVVIETPEPRRGC